MTAAENADRYDPRAIQDKWQQRWAAMDIFRASDDPADPRPRTYVLDMFPYPSGDLHMGHAEAYALGDAMARYYTLRGHNVLHPIGWDAFGLPAENAAIRNNTHPADWTYKNIETQAASFRQYGVSFDWSRRLRPGVLPLDAVAVPAVLRAWPGLSCRRLRQLVPGRPDGAGQ
jgi:leucyl-tRNA synthetase